jgi:hypothetical protein
MIERLKESHGAAIGFKVAGRVTADEVKAFEPQIEFVIAQRKERPIGILADLSRMAVVGADKWEEVVAMVLAGTAVLQAETRYFTSSEINAAWEWVRTSKNADRVPVRTMYVGSGLFKDYIPEYTEL